MRNRLRVTHFTDSAALSALIFTLFFQWSRHRGLSFFLCAMLGTLMGIMPLYAIYLYKKHQRAKADGEKIVQRCVYALTMLPYTDALLYAASALADRYRLILPERYASDGILPAYASDGQRLVIGLYNEPVPVDKIHVHALHRRRNTLPAVLICTCLPTIAAENYALTLYPPLRLISAAELPLDTALAQRYRMPEKHNKKRTAASLLKAGSAQAVRCMLFSLGMMTAYLITNRMSLLIPALALAFIALLSKMHTPQETLF